MSNVKTRFAPSPTGRMHVGNLRTALYAYLIAKHAGGCFMLRIEDTDQERYMEGAVDIIYRTLEKAGLVHDEGPDKDGGVGPYVQSERQKAGIYMEYAKKLIEKGEAYYCFCDKERFGIPEAGSGRQGDCGVRQTLPVPVKGRGGREAGGGSALCDPAECAKRGRDQICG